MKGIEPLGFAGTWQNVKNVSDKIEFPITAYHIAYQL